MWIIEMDFATSVLTVNRSYKIGLRRQNFSLDALLNLRTYLEFKTNG